MNADQGLIALLAIAVSALLFLVAYLARQIGDLRRGVAQMQTSIAVIDTHLRYLRGDTPKTGATQ